MKKLALLLLIQNIIACNPFFAFRPTKLPSQYVVDQTHKGREVEIAIDSYGIPFIKARSYEEAMYGLGFMHARDRLFQLDLIRHLAMGKTTELFGKKTLKLDRKMRLLTYKLDEQLEKLSKSEHHLLDTYVQGVNDGAKKRGRSAEHFLLGLEFKAFSKKDALAIARLQAWQLGSDLFSELTSLRVARSNLETEAKKSLIAGVDDQGSFIIQDDVDKKIPINLSLPSYIDDQNHKYLHKQISDINPIGSGASNAWAIDKKFTKEGHAILMNDPHLTHAWPSNFYLATIIVADNFVTGASFVGLPGILVGATKNISWGVTASYINTQDAVLIDKSSLALWPQEFCIKGAQCVKERHYVSKYGPVLDSRFDRWVAKDDHVAVQWTGFSIHKHKNLATGFIKLAQASSVKEGVAVIKDMTLPGVNIVLADKDGHVGYAYAGVIPKRDSKQNPYLPLDGKANNSLWTKFLQDTPWVVDPKEGFIVTANQNIFNKNSNKSYGTVGAQPYRALRIRERILSFKDKISFDDQVAIQMDMESREARDLALGLGTVCRDHFSSKSSNKKKFAQLIHDFDGRFSTDSLGALPYDILVKRVIRDVLAEVVYKKPRPFFYIGQTAYGVKKLLASALKGNYNPLFKNIDQLKERISSSCEEAYKDIIAQAGSRVFKWRWGRHHYLKRKSPLARALLVGKFFQDKKREVAGSASSPLAEAGYPVYHGANLRFRVIMGKKTQAYAVLDSGNSGTVGSPNAFDQVNLWHKGEAIKLNTHWPKDEDETIKSRFKIIF